MSDVWAVPAFFGVKYLAYSAYCYAGLAWLRKTAVGRPWLHAFGLALLRMGMGVALGTSLITYFSRFHTSTNRLGIPEWFGSWIWTYAICYGILRLLEWSLMAYLSSGRTVRFSGRAVSWAVGGVSLSFLTDWIGFASAIGLVGGIC